MDLVADQVVLAIPFTTLRQVDTRAVPVHPLHRRAIDQQPMRSIAKFSPQYSSRIWDAHHQTGNAYTDRIVQGTGDATDYQSGPAGVGSRSLYSCKAFFVRSSGDPHIFGAHSYLAVGQYTAFNGIQGRQERRLHFAGEQTSINFQGYIEGGLRSGYRCAAEIAGTRRG